MGHESPHVLYGTGNIPIKIGNKKFREILDVVSRARTIHATTQVLCRLEIHTYLQIELTSPDEQPTDSGPLAYHSQVPAHFDFVLGVSVMYIPILNPTPCSRLLDSGSALIIPFTWTHPTLLPPHYASDQHEREPGYMDRVGPQGDRKSLVDHFVLPVSVHMDVLEFLG